MAEYIEREALEKSIREKANPKGCTHITPQDVYSTVLAIVECEPTANVAEVRHGKWLDCIETGTSVAGINITALTGYKCSLCGRYEGKKEPYCNCGAKMDLVEK